MNTYWKVGIAVVVAIILWWVFLAGDTPAEPVVEKVIEVEAEEVAEPVHDLQGK